MASVHIVDTSVFCNLLDIPGKNQDRNQARDDLEKYIEQGGTLLLPTVAVYETGNHIAQCDDGRVRRQLAERFSDWVSKALAGDIPFQPTLIHSAEEMARWLGEFPKHAQAKIGLGDLSIIKLWESQCELNPARRVRIWAYDDHLQGYDQAARI